MTETSISQSVHSATLQAGDLRLKCVVLLKTAKSVELLLRGATLNVDQHVQLCSGESELDLVVLELTPAGAACVVHCGYV